MARLLCRLALLPLLLLAACATSPDPLPSRFRTGVDPRYPPERYVVAVAEGATREEARQRAVAAIALQLRASVQATERLRATLRSDDTGASWDERLDQEIRVESRFDRPEWVEIVDAVHRDGRVHVLAVVERRRSAALLEEELIERREAIRHRIELAESAPDLRSRSRLLAEAGRLVQQLLPDEAILAALEGRGSIRREEAAALARARRRLEEARRATRLRICVAPALEHGPARDVAARFAEVLAGAGVAALACDAEGGEWVLSGRLVAETTAPARPTPGAWQRFCTARLDYRLATVEGALLVGGSQGGVRTRAGGHDFHDACLASASRLAQGLAVELGLLDPPAR